MHSASNVPHSYPAGAAHNNHNQQHNKQNYNNTAPSKQQPAAANKNSNSKLYPAVAAARSMTDVVTQTLHIPSRIHGHIIGPKGTVINRLSSDYNVRIRVPQASQQSDEVTVQGPAQGVQNCCDEIERIIGKKPSVEALTTVKFQIPHQSHGALIGKGGSILKEIEQKFSVTVNIPKKEEASDVVTVIGSNASCIAARNEFETRLHQSVKVIGDAAVTRPVKPQKLPLKGVSRSLRHATKAHGSLHFSFFKHYNLKSLKLLIISKLTLPVSLLFSVTSTK